MNSRRHAGPVRRSRTSLDSWTTSSWASTTPILQCGPIRTSSPFTNSAAFRADFERELEALEAKLAAGEIAEEMYFKRRKEIEARYAVVL